MNILSMISRNLLHGPMTLRYPDRLAPAPEFRGVVTNDPEVCICCGICVRVCPSAALSLVNADAGCAWTYDPGACTFCGRCQDHCPVASISQAEDRPPIYAMSRELATTIVVPASRCDECGAPRRRVSVKLLERAYGTVTPELIARMSLCPACRAKATAAQIKDASRAEAATEGDADGR